MVAEKLHTEEEWEKLDKKRNKKPLKAKIYFGLFIFLIVLSAFLFWSFKNAGADEEGVGATTTLIAAIITLLMGLFFGCLTCIHFLRARSVAGGLFLTTALSTAVFLGASQLVGWIIPPAVMAFHGAEPGAETGAFSLIVLLAQIGLFAMWFAFLMFTIKVQVSPIKRVDKSLERILAGQDVRRIKIGKSKQYKEIEKKLEELQDTLREQRKSDCIKVSRE